MSLEIITKALEEHRDAVHEIKDAADGLKSRVLDIEQKIAGGFDSSAYTHGQQSDQLREFKSELWGKDNVQEFPGEGSKIRTRVQAGHLTKNTILGETSGEPNGVIAQFQRRPGVVGGAFRSLNVLDLIPVEQATSNMVEYSRELSWTNDAAETAEGAQKPESDVTFEVVQEPIRTVAHWLKISEQAWQDSPWLQSYVTERLNYGIRKRLQTQVISGNGTSPNLAGITTAGRHTAFTPTTSETALDALNRSKYEIEGSDYAADFVILNPADWGAIERQRRGSSDGAFSLGDGGAAGYVASGMSAMVWGLPVITSNDLAAGKFIMGATDAMRIFQRQEATVEFFREDEDNVQKNLITVRAELRAGFGVMIPAAVRYGDLTA